VSRATTTALILAGGKATRMGGIAKHALLVDGEPIFARQVRVLAPRVAEIIVSGAEIAGHRCVRDAIAGVGPLAGIAAGLAAAPTEHLLVVAGDMPELPIDAIDALLVPQPVDAIGTRVAGLPEPLLCCLRVAPCRAAVDAMLAAGDYKASRLFERVETAWIELAHVPRNINRREDL
jgi:molybdopterin-guanine dinucleotide biosynthesis protein A